MRRKVERALKYWSRGRLARSPGSFMHVDQTQIRLGGKLFAYRRRALGGKAVVFADEREYREQRDKGLDINFSPAHLSLVGSEKLHRIVGAFSRYDQFRKLKRHALAAEIHSFAQAIAEVRMVLHSLSEYGNSAPPFPPVRDCNSGAAAPFFQFVRDGDPHEIAIKLLSHKYEAYVYCEDGIPTVQPGAARIDEHRLMFRHFDDAILYKLKYDGVKVFEV